MVDEEATQAEFTGIETWAKAKYLRHLAKREGRNIADVDEYRSRLSAAGRDNLRNYVTVEAWNAAKGHFVELLSLLTLLKHREIVDGPHERHEVWRGVTPIPTVHEGQIQFIGTQQHIKNTVSGLDAIADIVVAKAKGPLTSDNIDTIIECKATRRLDSRIVRAEAGRARDFGVLSYGIVSYKKTTARLKECARKLGIHLQDLGLDTSLRDDYLRRPSFFLEHLSTTLDSIHNSRSVLVALDDDVRRLREKLGPDEE